MPPKDPGRQPLCRHVQNPDAIMPLGNVTIDARINAPVIGHRKLHPKQVNCVECKKRHATETTLVVQLAQTHARTNTHAPRAN